jgi:hypothetical protein
VELLKVLNQLDPASAIQHVEKMQRRIPEGVLSEYIKAIVGMSLRSSWAARARESRAARAEARTTDNDAGEWSAGVGAGVGAGAGAGASGSTHGYQDPMFVTMAEPSTRSEIWATLRVLAGAYVFLLVITTIIEERGMTRGVKPSSISQADKVRAQPGQGFRFRVSV